MQRQFPYLVIIQPVVLQGGDVIALRFLLAVQREGQAVDVCLADNEALAGFVIRQDGKVEGLFGTGDEGLLDVEVADGHDNLLLNADFTLPGRSLHHVQIVPRHVVFAFPHAPVHQWNGDTDRHHLLLHGMPVCFTEFLCHLVEADAGVDAGVEARFLLRLVYCLLGFQHFLTKPQKFRIVGLSGQQSLINRYGQRPRTSRKRHPDIRVLLHIQERCQRKHGALQGTGGILQSIAGVHHVEFQRQQVGTADGGYFQALHADAVEGIGGDGIVLGQVIFRLCHGKRKEIGSGLLGHPLCIVDILLLHLLVLQRLNPAFPTERIVTDQTLRVAQTNRNTGELGILVSTEAPHIAQLRIQIERTARQVEILSDGKIAVCIEGLLAAIDVKVLFGVVTLGDITVVLCRSHVQRQAGKAVCLIGAVFPITGQIHVLGAEGFQRTVIRQGNGLLQIERYPLLGKSGKGSQTEQKYKT